jgi:hypothetical protein
MRDLMKSSLHRVRTGWFWPLVLLALPNCVFQVNGLPALPQLDPGMPRGDAVMCDIERNQGAQRRCANDSEKMTGIPLSSAAVALATGQHFNIGLDYSAAAQMHCGPNNPEAIDFQGQFPDGLPVCVNCGHSTPANAPGICVAECRDLIANDMAPTATDPLAFCTANARPSTNFPKSGCFNGACSPGGTLRSDFADPRRTPEPVVWDDLIGTNAGGVAGNDVTKVAASSMVFDAGAVSDQWISGGDAYVEFEASELGKSHVIGLAVVPMGCMHPTDCHDADPSIADINFAVSLNANNQFYVLEGGNVVGNSHGTYSPGQRFRVTVKNKPDGSYDVEYSYITGPCLPGNRCNETVFATHNIVTPMYPLRVDASFRESPATLANVTIVRIQ